MKNPLRFTQVTTSGCTLVTAFSFTAAGEQGFGSRPVLLETVVQRRVPRTDGLLQRCDSDWQGGHIWR